MYSEGTRGTLLGTIEKGTISFVVDGYYSYIGIKGNDGASMFDSISLIWEVPAHTYSNISDMSVLIKTQFANLADYESGIEIYDENDVLKATIENTSRKEEFVVEISDYPLTLANYYTIIQVKAYVVVNETKYYVTNDKLISLEDMVNTYKAYENNDSTYQALVRSLADAIETQVLLS